jgi:hypothetical protein
MSQLHPTEEDQVFARGHRAAGFSLRIGWVLKLREALEPFAEGRATEEDRARAKTVLDETREWLKPEDVKP